MICEVMIQMSKPVATGTYFSSMAAMAKVWNKRNRSALCDCDSAGAKVVPTDSGWLQCEVLVCRPGLLSGSLSPWHILVIVTAWFFHKPEKGLVVLQNLQWAI